MMQFTRTLAAWKTPAFADTLKKEITGLEPGVLPLQQGLQQGSYSSDQPVEIMIIASAEDADSIRIKTGIFYKSIIAGCNCADDPSSVNENSEYCVVQFDIRKQTAEVSISLVYE